MKETLSTPWFNLEKQIASADFIGEHLTADNPYAKSVAEPLFSANLEAMGIVCRKGYNSTKLHLSVCHNILLLLQGELNIQHENKITKLKPGDLVYSTPSTNMKFTSHKNEVTWWVYFKIYDTENWDKLKQNGAFIESYDSGALMFILSRRIFDAYNSRNSKSMNTALGDSHMLLRLLRRLVNRTPSESRRLQTLRGLVSEISKNPEKEWTQSTMANKLFVSARTLLRLFRNEYGCAPTDMVIQQRLNQAMQLLINSDFSIEEIAYQCGYENASSFSRTFLKHIGSTPGHYRKNSKGKNGLVN
jgi:AraC-like DNA-binding protein